MTYKVGIITGSALPGKDLIDAITTDALALGWVQVESAQVETTYTWRVLKNPAAINSAGIDFHIGLGWATTGGATIIMALFEDWNTSTKKAYKFAPNTTGLTPGASYENTQTAASLPATGSTVYSRTSPYINGDSYWYSITVDRLCLITVPAGNTQSNAAWYIGLYESFLSPADDPAPLVITDCTQAFPSNSSFAVDSNGPGSSTREPKTNTSNYNNFGAGLAPWRTLSDNRKEIAWTSIGPTADTTAELYTQRPLVSRVIVTGRAETALRGLFRDLYAAAAPSASNAGDEIEWVFGGVTYRATKMRGTNYRFYNFYMGQV